MRAPGMASPSMEKRASRTRSVVGRVSVWGTLMGMPPAVPAMMRMVREAGVVVNGVSGDVCR